MKIATHNVEFLFDEGEHKHSGKTWLYTKDYVNARIENLASLYSKIDADILFLQEVASPEVIQQIIEKTGKDYSFFRATPEKNGVGNAVIYKSKDCICESISATSDFPVFVEGDVDVIGPRIWSRRAFVKVVTNYNGKKLNLFGLHLKSRFLMPLKNKEKIDFPITSQIAAADGLIRSDTFTFTQARKMREIIDELFATDKDSEIIVAGDFNSIESDPAFRIVQGEIKTLDDSLFTPATILPEENRFSFIGNTGKKLIDHLLISKSLKSKIKSFVILNDKLEYHDNLPPSPSFIESDHTPLVLELI